MRAAVIAAMATALAACSDSKVTAAEDAERRYDLVQASGSLDEACAAAKEVRDAWLKTLDKSKYERAALTASIQCRTADLTGGYLPADALKRAEITRRADDIEAVAANAALEEAGDAIDRAGDAVANADAAIAAGE